MYLLLEMLIFTPALVHEDPGLTAAWALEEASKKSTADSESRFIKVDRRAAMLLTILHHKLTRSTEKGALENQFLPYADLQHYGIMALVKISGIESRRISEIFRWWAQTGSNRRPTD